jgi:hypothetical protein
VNSLLGLEQRAMERRDQLLGIALARSVSGPTSSTSKSSSQSSSSRIYLGNGRFNAITA